MTFNSQSLKFCMKKSWQGHEKWQKNSLISVLDDTGWQKDKYWGEVPLKNPYIYIKLTDPLKFMEIATETLVYITQNTEVIPIGSQKSRPFHITGPSKDKI